jgi:hypothetical protein
MGLWTKLELNMKNEADDMILAKVKARVQEEVNKAVLTINSSMDKTTKILSVSKDLDDVEFKENINELAGLFVELSKLNQSIALLNEIDSNKPKE